MPLDREITNPKLGLSQEPTAISWKSTLRSPSPSPRGPTRSTSLSQTRGRDSLRESLRSRSPSPTLNRSLNKSFDMSNSRKSTSSRLKSSFNSSSEIKELETDYIKNLQQQIYFLELEANYLRDQARKATELHPQMTTEADRMLKKLRSLQNETDGLQIEVRRKESALGLMTKEKAKVLVQLSEQEKLREREKRLLQEEIVQVKRERDGITLANTRLENQSGRLAANNESLNLKLMDSDNTVASLRGQLSEKTEQLRLCEIQLDDKRVVCVQAETRAKDVEDHFYKTVARQHNKEVAQLKDEISSLERQLKDADRRADQELTLKLKSEDERQQLLQQNDIVSSQLNETSVRLSREKDKRNESEMRRSQNMAEISDLSDREKEMRVEIRALEDSLSVEQARNERITVQLKQYEEEAADADITVARIRAKVSSMEMTNQTLEKEVTSLTHDKQVLTDHVTDLQRKIARIEVDYDSLRSRLRELESELNVVEGEKIADNSLQSEKWREFETLADSMKKLSRSMAGPSSPPGRSSSRNN